MILVWSGEKDMCAPPTTSGISSGSPPETATRSVRGLPEGHRKTMNRLSEVHCRKCPMTPTSVSGRASSPSALMTAAMAFFSIALTLNLTGVRLSRIRLSDLRPTAVRSFMERQITMASTPIIRYYDHLRVVYEVQSRMRELRKTTQSSTDGQDNQKKQPSGPGESKQNPSHKDGGSRVDPPQQSGTPNLNDSSDYLETSLSHDCLDRPAHSGGSEKAIRERSTVWIA